MWSRRLQYERRGDGTQETSPISQPNFATAKKNVSEFRTYVLFKPACFVMEVSIREYCLGRDFGNEISRQNSLNGFIM